MKNFIRENGIYILSFLILLGIMLYYCDIYYTNIANYRKYWLLKSQDHQENYASCIEKGEPIDPKQSCETIIIEHNNSYDMFYQFVNSIDEGQSFLSFFSPFFVMIPAVFGLVKKTKKGNIKNQLVRQSYNSFFKKEYKKSLKAALIVPTVVLIVFLIAGIYTSFRVSDPLIYPYYESVIFNTIVDQQFWFLISFILTIIAQSILYINIAYIITYYGKNLIIICLGCIITFYVLELGLECLGLIHLTINGEPFDMWTFLLTTIWDYTNIKSVFTLLIINTFYALISFFIMHMVYRSKEKMVIKNSLKN